MTERPLAWGGGSLLAAALIISCSTDAPINPTSTDEPSRVPVEVDATAFPAQFHDVAREAGLTVKNLTGTPEKPFIVESMGPGACWLDFDQDGRLDLYVVNGLTYPDQLPDPAPHDTLYRSGTDGTFLNVTELSGIADTGWGGGCAVGDIDNDGWPDLYVLNHGANRLWRNRGDGSFEDWTERGRVDHTKWSSSGAFADFDKDGDLDLFLSNYADFDWDNPQTDGGLDFCIWHGITVFCGPRGMKPSPPVYYENNGDGTFTDATENAGFLAAPATYGLGVALLDYDRDGWLDLYMANDARANYLWRNRGDGSFEEVSFGLAAGLSGRGKEQAGMGVDVGDYDNDGWPDLFVTNFSEDTYTLYRNEETFFNDVSFATGITMPTFLPLGWGAKFADFDLDGDLDLLAVNGHVYPQVVSFDSRPPFTYAQRANLLENRDGRFFDVAEHAGPGMRTRWPGRGVAVADYDNDGDDDILIANIDEIPALLKNDLDVAARNWIGMRLEGRDSNRDAIGAFVTVTAPGIATQSRSLTPSGSFRSSNDPRMRFGLGSADQATIEIAWPSGKKARYENVPLGQYLRIVEGATDVTRDH